MPDTESKFLRLSCEPVIITIPVSDISVKDDDVGIEEGTFENGSIVGVLVGLNEGFSTG